MPSTLDCNRPVQTRDGRPARILATDLKGPHSMTMVVAVTDKEGEEWLALRLANGRVSDSDTHPEDIINVSKKHVGWINVYLRKDSIGIGDLFNSREAADVYASPNRIACVEVEVTEGEGL